MNCGRSRLSSSVNSFSAKVSVSGTLVTPHSCFSSLVKSQQLSATSLYSIGYLISAIGRFRFKTQNPFGVEERPTGELYQASFKSGSMNSQRILNYENPVRPKTHSKQRFHPVFSRAGAFFATKKAPHNAEPDARFQIGFRALRSPFPAAVER
ncbi:hypothetical protein SDC9_169936 [bioreactor metagenome]|uniref:Uncharacterized protein n=1 Tax=bioreactor metagenome TaxID=1076179 RepID=A0A645GFK7_9ZZZZ